MERAYYIMDDEVGNAWWICERCMGSPALPSWMLIVLPDSRGGVVMYMYWMLFPRLVDWRLLGNRWRPLQIIASLLVNEFHT